jgi:NAD(P)H dehydrogenase (quinone)
MGQMILLTGAAGKTGTAVLHALAETGEPVRAFVRDQAQAERVSRAGAAKVAIGDLEIRSDLAAAIKGTRAVYHICPNMHPAEIEIGRMFIGLCRDEGVERFVFHSVFHPQIEAMPHHWNKMRVEETLIGSGLDYTILQPTAYMQNVLARIEEIRTEGVYRVPYDVETRISMVDLMDAAACAARVLTEPGFSAGTYELVGPGFFSQIEIAEKMGEILGIQVQAEQIPLEQWKAQAQRGTLGEYAVDTLYKMFSYYGSFNFRGNQKALEMLLGRTPTSFKDFLSRELSLSAD